MEPLSNHSSVRPRSHASPSPAIATMIVIGMLAMVVIPAALTLHSVSLPGKLSVGENPSPHGYTWSLLLFIVPICDHRSMVPAQRRFGHTATRILENHRSSRAFRLGSRLSLRAMVFLLSQ